MKRYRWAFGILALLTAVILWGWERSGWDGKNDIRLALVSENNLGLVAISPSRKMVNVLNINPEVMVWIPGGMGWYRSDRIKRIERQENNSEIIPQVFFYNFGFAASKTVYLDNTEEWMQDKVLIPQLGVWGWIRFRLQRDNFIVKTETLDDSLTGNRQMLDEVMLRDFADNTIANLDYRITVVNSTEESGLASFVGNKIEWMGFSVIGFENSEKDVEGCVIEFDSEESGVYMETIRRLMGCQKRVNENLNRDEVEIILGRQYAEMIKYPSYKLSYVRTF